MIIFDFNTPITAQDDLNIIVVDEQDDGYALIVLHTGFEEPIIKRPNLLCKDRPWSEGSLIDMVCDLVMYDVGNPRTRIPNQVFSDMDLDPCVSYDCLNKAWKIEGYASRQSFGQDGLALTTSHGD